MKLFFLAGIFAVVHVVTSGKLVESPDVSELYENTPRHFSHGKDDGLIQGENFYSWGLNSINDRDITFHFYSQASVDKSNAVKASQVNDLLKLTSFNTSKDTLIIIHGWTHSYQSPPNALIRPAALRDRDINVIAVDWSPIAVQAYTVAVAAVEDLGRFVGDYLLKLVDVHGYDLNRVTIAGHSLGAHIAGCAGLRTSGRINTIVGLDPAGNYPYVESNIANRLDPTDAQFVQVIVSSGMAPTFLMGHTNYYPNGGLVQPGCGIDPLVVCSHTRAVEYYAESLTNNQFKAKKCTTWINYQMGMFLANGDSYMGGLPVQRSASGSYFLSTNSKAPFAKGV